MTRRYIHRARQLPVLAAAALAAVTSPGAHGAPGSATYQYDEAGRLKSAVYEDGSSITYEIDSAGNRKTVVTNVPPPGVQWAATTYSVNENGGSITVTVNRIGGTAGTASVDYRTLDGSALAGSDYSTTNGTLTWTSGEATPKTIVVPILDDTSIEGNEAFIVRLSSPVGLVISGPTDNTVTIVDTEPGSVQFSASSYSAGEGDGSTTITVTRVNAFAGAVSVRAVTNTNTATLNTDFGAVDTTLSWGNGEGGSKTFQIPIFEDSLIEGAEIANVSLINPTGGVSIAGPLTVPLTIVDNDHPPPGVITLPDVQSRVLESAGVVQIRLTRTGGSYGAVSVRIDTSDIPNQNATAGVDYVAVTNGTVTWSDGDSADKTFPITIINDSAAEGTELFQVAISNPTGGASLGSTVSALIPIDDDDTQAVPATPTGFGVSTGHGPSFNVFWNASVTTPGYYELDEDIPDGDYVPPGYTRYTIPAGTNGKVFTNKGSGTGEFDWWYRVRACNGQGQCSAWSVDILKIVCGSSGVCH